MNNSSKTERADYLFRVSDWGDDTCWISTELRDQPNLTAMEHGFLGFDLIDPSIENARKVADFLNEHIQWTSMTSFPAHPLFARMRSRGVDGKPF